MFSKMLVFLCRVSRGDGECDPPYVLEEKQLDLDKGIRIYVYFVYVS